MPSPRSSGPRTPPSSATVGGKRFEDAPWKGLIARSQPRLHARRRRRARPLAHAPREGAAVNRLAAETSPYLLQHADNPVDWYPWGEEALERARAEDRPILLSIGYAACHWCHVMEHESFEDAETARLMNEHFVNVKVDREERPGPRRALHGRGRGADRARRLADDGVPHSRGRAVLRRHVLPARAAPRAAGFRAGARGGLAISIASGAATSRAQAERSSSTRSRPRARSGRRRTR